MPDSFSDPVDKQKINNQFLIIEQYRDFIEWLFETHVDYMTIGEAMEEFEKYLLLREN